MAENVVRTHVRIPEDRVEVLKYWATRRGMSVNEYINEAIDAQIRKENGDLDVPNVLTCRVNQLVDIVTELSSNLKSLEDVTTSGFDSLLGLTRGDNYLLEHEDGEI
ncbi:MAG: hypothetical protein Q4B30_00905 [Coriobacteriaceae bacterium]|nr:hypothetical protein [Coriobacteriaceae bacterium]